MIKAHFFDNNKHLILPILLAETGKEFMSGVVSVTNLTFDEIKNKQEISYELPYKRIKKDSNILYTFNNNLITGLQLIKITNLKITVNEDDIIIKNYFKGLCIENNHKIDFANYTATKGIKDVKVLKRLLRNVKEKYDSNM